MTKIRRKKSAQSIKKGILRKIHHKKTKRSRKSKKGLLDKLLDIFD